MASHARVLNLTNRCHVNADQAKGWIEQGSCVWVETGISIRMLGLAERLVRRSELARMAETFPPAELPGIVVTGIVDIRHERALAWQGTQFAVDRQAGGCL